MAARTTAPLQYPDAAAGLIQLAGYIERAVAPAQAAVSGEPLMVAPIAISPKRDLPIESRREIAFGF